MPKSVQAPANPHDKLPELQAHVPTHALLYQGPASLSQWLDVSWFYPQGFIKDSIQETPEAWTALGNGIAYKFFKLGNSPTEDHFPRRWRLACEELLDHQELAPQLYLGLRLLRWVDEEPQWMSEKTAKSLDTERPPASAHDVAVVLQRIPENELLSKKLIREPEQSATTLTDVAERLKDFHHQSIRKSLVTFRDDPKLLNAILVERYYNPLHRFILAHGSFLDPFSQIAFEELRGFLASFLQRNTSTFDERLKGGAFIDCHGNLRLDQIAVNDDDGIAIFGRLPRSAPERFADALSDVASLALDMETRGHLQEAQVFESQYFGPSPSEPELYAFYKVAEATRRAREYFEENLEDADVGGPIFLSYALKLALRIRNPFVIVIGASDEEDCLPLANSIEALTDGTICRPGDGSDLPFGKYFPARPGLDRMLQHAETEIFRGQSVILAWPLNREEERLVLQRFAKERVVPILFVSLSKTAEKALEARGKRWTRSLVADTTQHLSELHVRHLVLEPSLPQPDLALSILRELGRSDARARGRKRAI